MSLLSVTAPVFWCFSVTENRKSLLLNAVQLLSTARSHCPLNADFSFVTRDKYSCFNPFIPGFAVARPDHLINVYSYIVFNTGCFFRIGALGLRKGPIL